MLKVFGLSASGNCYKIKLLLEQLHTPYQWEEVDIFNAGTQTPQFLAMNPNAQVPVLEIRPGEFLPESNAILFYLAEGTPFWPTERLARAQVLQWLCFEQYSHEPYIAVARRINKFMAADHPRRAELPRLLERGQHALAVMEQHLATRHFFVNDAYSIADIALFAYTHVAHEGGFDLTRFPNINAWLARVKTQQGFVPLA
jgi:glutathione S-transferase